MMTKLERLRRSRITARRQARLLGCLILVLLSAVAVNADCTFTSSGSNPLPDLGTGRYLGQAGGLYPGGRSVRPPELQAAALERAAEIQPLNSAGNPDPTGGRVVLLSVGMSNTKQEFQVFVDQAMADPAKHPQLVVVNAAREGRAADRWSRPDAGVWDRADEELAAAGVGPRQVQAVWIKQALQRPWLEGEFPDHARVLQGYLEDIARNLKIRYPNVQLAYFSSRTRAYTLSGSSNPEPYAYESGFSVRWAIENQLAGSSNLNFDPRKGAVVAPLMLWGPYLWADGTRQRSDGFSWLCGDTRGDDFTHPSPSGMAKVAQQLRAFFKSDPTASPWFLKTGVDGAAPRAGASANVRRGAVPLRVAFGASSSDSDGSIREQLWTFDDGTFASGSQPFKTFHSPGTYQARLVVSDDRGNSVVEALEIEALASSDGSGGGGGDGGGGDGGGSGEDCPLPAGHGRYCSDCGPCGEGQGDCDTDAECRAGLVCTDNTGAQVGFAPNIDVCLPDPNAPAPCDLAPGHGSFCQRCGPCGEGQGDCDRDSDCRSGLVCANNVGAEFGFGANIDVCRSEAGLGGPTVCSLPPGHGRFCRDCGPCGPGEGDCDGDGECRSGLTCVANSGAEFGFGPNIDVCQ